MKQQSMDSEGKECDTLLYATIAFRVKGFWLEIYLFLLKVVAW
jgi:hypothetical protein